MKKLIAAALLVASIPSFAATAMFTGRQEQVQTVTYKFVWRCEYRYLSQTFYRLFETSCPAMIEVM